MTTRAASAKARGWRRRAASAALLTTVSIVGFARPAGAIEQVTVTPDSDLPDTANVNVSGTGFPASRTVYVSQCADVGGVASCTDPIASGQTNASGNFGPVPATVKATFQTLDGPVQCKTNCRILVEEPATGRFGERSIAFDTFSK